MRVCSTPASTVAIRCITPALDAAEDFHTVEPGWGTDDAVGHGTEMAGLALVGDLNGLLAGTDSVEIEHRLESVKLIPQVARPGAEPSPLMGI